MSVRLASAAFITCLMVTAFPAKVWSQRQIQVEPAQRTTRPATAPRQPRRTVAPRVDPALLQGLDRPGTGQYILRGVDFTADGGSPISGLAEPPTTYWHEASRWSVVYITGTIHAGGLQLELANGVTRAGEDTDLWVRFDLDDLFPGAPAKCLAQADSQSRQQLATGTRPSRYLAVAKLLTGDDAECWAYFRNLDTVTLNPPQVSVIGNPSATLALIDGPRSLSYGNPQARTPATTDRGSGKFQAATDVDISVPGGASIANLRENGQPSNQDFYSSYVRITGAVHGLDAPLPDTQSKASFYRVDFDLAAIADNLPVPLAANCGLRQGSYAQNNVLIGSTQPRKYVTYLIFSNTLALDSCWRSFKALAGRQLNLGQNVTLTARWDDGNGMQETSFPVSLPAPVSVPLGNLLPRESGD